MVEFAISRAARDLQRAAEEYLAAHLGDPVCAADLVATVGARRTLFVACVALTPPDGSLTCAFS